MVSKIVRVPAAEEKWRVPQKFNYNGNGYYARKAQRAIRCSNRNAMSTEAQHEHRWRQFGSFKEH